MKFLILICYFQEEVGDVWNEVLRNISGLLGVGKAIIWCNHDILIFCSRSLVRYHVGKLKIVRKQ
jgi:hypothetical protein